MLCFTRPKVIFSTVLMLLLSGFGYANNLPPLASFSNDVNRAFFFSGETITFDGSGSIDQDEGGSSITYYRWRVDGVIVYQGSSATHFTRSFSLSSGQNSKTVQVQLEVRDDEFTWTTNETKMTKTYTIRRGQDRQFYLKDHLGSVRVTVDEEGEPLGYDDYYPFGLQMPTRSSNTSNPNDAYKYTGHERDTEAGLTFDYMGARTYDPLLGIFQQIDPLLEFASPYSYVGGNPVNSTDPTGMSSCAENGEVGLYSAESSDPCDNAVSSKSDETTIAREENENKEVNIQDDKCPKCFGKGKSKKISRRPKLGYKYGMYGKENKNYNGKGIGGTNFVGDGPDDVDPNDLLNQGIVPLDEIDQAAFEHDIAYFNNNAGGAIDALFNLDVTSADIELVAAATDIINRYEEGLNPNNNPSIDKVTGEPISFRTYTIAVQVRTFFLPVSIHKVSRISRNHN